MDEPKVYTIREFSKIMKISEGMVYKMCKDGRLRVVHFGDRALIPATVIDELLSAKNQTVKCQ